MGHENEWDFYDITDILSDAENSGDDSRESLDPESWHDWNSEHLLNMYSIIKAYHENEYMVPKPSFNDWCIFLYNRRKFRIYSPLYVTSDEFASNMYDSLVQYCTDNELEFMGCITFEDFSNLIYYRDV